MLTLPITEITKIKVEPGDVVVVKSAKVMAPSHRDSLAAKLRDLLPGAEIVVLDEGMSIEAVKPGADAAPKKPAGRRATSKKTAKP